MSNSIKDALWGEKLGRLDKDNAFAASLATEGFHYLASPYTHYPVARNGMTGAFNDVAKLAALFLKQKVPVFSPITHFHPIGMQGNLDTSDLSIWLPADAPFIRSGKSLIVATLPGWDTSTGVREEINAFREQRKPVHFLDPRWLGAALGYDPLKLGTMPADLQITQQGLALPIGLSGSEIYPRFNKMAELVKPARGYCELMGLKTSAPGAKL